MTMTGTVRVRRMDEIGGKDIAVGQEWVHATTHNTDRRRMTVAAIVRDRVTLRDASGTDTVTFGTLLSDWVLAAEA